MYHVHCHLRVIPIENGKVKFPFPMNTSVTLDVVDGADVKLRKVVKMSSVCIRLLLSDVEPF